MSWKDYKVVSASLKEIYQASTEESALQALNKFSGKWYEKYPKIGGSLRQHQVNIHT